MADSSVLYQVNERIATVTLNRPEKKNAINDDLINGLGEALDRAESDNDVRVVLLRGAGSDFCSGADLSALEKIADSSIYENLQDAEQLVDLFIRFRKFKAPIVAA